MFSQQVDLFQQFNGRYDFTAIGNTLNPSANPCMLLDSSSADLNLGLTETLVSAQLYWSAPGPGDFNVSLNEIPVTADRTFSLISGVGREYFAANADVTNIIAANGNGQYTFADMQIDLAASNTCSNGTDFGGWAIYIIYEDPALNLNQISLFDGLEFVSGTNPQLDITLSNIDASTDELAKIGFLAWEGDLGNPVNESLRINGVLIQNVLNPPNNAFNGTNSYTGSTELYNMDLDVYDLQGIVMPGDTSIDISLTSNQDFVMVNNLITSVNSEIPDATIVIDNLGVLCQNRDINVNYTVFNVNSTAFLPANTPIAFYINNTLVGQSQTVADIPIDGSESGTITLNLPLGTPVNFDLKAVVDDVGDGTGIVAETNETNNEFILPVDLNEAVQFLGPDIQSCIGMTVTIDTGVVDPAFSFQWFFNGTPLPSETDPTLDVTVDGTYTCIVTEGACTATDSIDVFFNVQPFAEPTIDLFQCDANGDLGFFDLTVNDPFILGTQNPADYNVSYHLTQAEANSGANPITPATAYPIATPPVQPIFARVEELTGTCYATDEFFIQFDTVSAGPMTNIGGLCDEDSNGEVLLNLVALKNAEALNGQDPNDYSVSYHPTQLDAENDTAELPNPYNVTTSPETVYVRVENNASPPGTCAAISSFIIEFFAAPVLIEPSTYEVCDELPNDGFAEFNLPTKDDEITGSNPEAVVVYYEDFNDALNGVNPIANPTMFVNTTIGFQTIYARADNVNSTDCFNVIALDLLVNDSPPITDPISDYILCDNDEDGFEEFDLTSKDAEISNILVNLVLTYHTSEADAEAGASPITPADAYVSGGETVWVRAVNLGGCYTVGSFALVLDTVPVFTPVPEYTECDDDGDGVEDFDLSGQNLAITGGDLDLTVSYHASEADADAAASPLADPYTSAGETVWVRVESSTRGCYGVFPMDLVVVPPPVIFEPDPLVYCDDDNDGFGTFTLTDADDQVVGGNPGGNLEVSYHALFVQAQNGTVPLSSPYENTVPFDQTVYARLFDTATGCYNIAPLRLLVLDTPQISDPSPLVACDADGVAVFDLTEAEAEILAGLTGGPYVVEYFEDPGLSVAITNTTAYPNVSNPQTVYVTVGDSGNECAAQTTLELVVDLPPGLTEPAPYVLCDGDNPGDGVEVFDLTTRISEITGGSIGVVVTFHETLDDARTGADPIDPADAHENRDPVTGAVVNPKTVYIRGEDSSTGCAETGGASGLVLELSVVNVPDVDPPTPLEVCDTDGDGFALFDLTSKDMEIMGNDPSITVSYHETLLDAQEGTFALSSPYANIVADLQTVWARAEFTAAPNDNGCFTVVPLDLVVLESPTVPLALDPLIACEPGGVAVFDLTEREGEILDGQDPLLYTVSYHETLAGAQQGTGAIAVPTAYTNMGNPQTVYVRVSGNANACAATGEFQLEVREPPVALQPEPLVVCDDLGVENDGIAVFDLTVKDTEISGGGIGIGVGYYLTAQDAQDGTNAIDPATAYENRDPVTGGAINPQTIYVRVDDAVGDCSGFTSMTIRVRPNPEPVEPDPIELCDVNDPNDGVEVFDLTVRAAQILNGGNWDLGYYETYALAVEGTDPIADPTAHENRDPLTGAVVNPKTVYVRVTDSSTEQMCFEVVPLELIVNPLPDTGAEVPPLAICQVPNTGSGIFDLTLRDVDVLGGQDPGFFQVSYYRTLDDAQNMFFPIPNPGSYFGNSGEIIYPGILDTRTDCYNSSEDQGFELRVDDGAVANAPPEPYTVCDNLGPNDGIAEFTLDDPSDPMSPAQQLRDAILGGQDPLLFPLTFHETLAAAQAGTDPLGAVYVNLVNPQVIYARVENGGQDNDCSAVTEVVLKVDQLPELSIEGEYRLCLDADGLPIEPESGGPSPPVLDTGLTAEDYTFSWSVDGTVLVGEVGPLVVATVPGTYVVVVTDRDTGCSAEYTAEVIASSPPVVFGAVVSEAFAGEPTITVTAEGLGTYEFQLDGGPFQLEEVFTGVSPGGHTVTIRDVNGCGSVVVQVGVVDYPRFMTPNQDGYHDTWNIIGIADADPTAKIYIFDRTGKLLKQISPTGEGWDGTFNGNPLPSSDYWFLVEYTEEGAQRQFRGHFTLKR